MRGVLSLLSTLLAQPIQVAAGLKRVVKITTGTSLGLPRPTNILGVPPEGRGSIYAGSCQPFLDCLIGSTLPDVPNGAVIQENALDIYITQVPSEIGVGGTRPESIYPGAISKTSMNETHLIPT